MVTHQTFLLKRPLFLQVYGLRQFRRTRRGTFGASEPTSDTPSNTGPRQSSPRRPLRRRRPSHPEDATKYPRVKRQEKGNSSNSSVGRGSQSPTTVAFGRAVEAGGPSTGGGRAVRSAIGKDTAVAEGQAAKNQMAEAKVEMLQGALASMRSKARAVICCDVTWIVSSGAVYCLLSGIACYHVTLIALYPHISTAQ